MGKVECHVCIAISASVLHRAVSVYQSTGREIHTAYHAVIKRLKVGVISSYCHFDALWIMSRCFHDIAAVVCHEYLMRSFLNLKLIHLMQIILFLFCFVVKT